MIKITKEKCPNGFPCLEISTDNQTFSFLSHVDLDQLENAFKKVYEDALERGVRIGVEQCLYRVKDVVNDFDEECLCEELIGEGYVY